ncbi:MAG: DUF1059 domain-containing protein [Archaeoglobaceae archaeon]
MYSVICKKCGEKVSGSTESLLVNHMAKHFEQEHNMDIPPDILDDIKRSVRRSMDKGLY